jgi:hypothetical protein
MTNGDHGPVAKGEGGIVLRRFEISLPGNLEGLKNLFRKIPEITV